MDVKRYSGPRSQVSTPLWPTEVSYKKHVKQTRRGTKSLPPTTIGWNDTHEFAFRDI